MTATADTLARTASVPDHDELVDRAVGLREILGCDAADVDRHRTLTERGVTALAESGLNRLMTPRVLGGYEADVRTVLDVTTELGKACGSAAWITAVYNSGNFVATLFGDRARGEVFDGNPDPRTAMVLVKPRAEVHPIAGGYSVSGKWGFASGSNHCDWIAVLLPLESGQRLALLPMRDLSVEDTWFVAGMRGTGSNTVVAKDVFVPGHRTTPFLPLVDGARPVERPDEPLQRTSISGVLQTFLLGAVIGGAKAALEYVVEKAPRRAIASSSYTSQTQSVPFQVDIANAAATIDTAELHARRAAEFVDKAARLGERGDITELARLRMDAAHTVRACREAVELLMTAHGTSAFAEFSPLQRIWRDIAVGSRHAGFGGHISEEVYGRAMLGLDPRQTSYLL